MFFEGSPDMAQALKEHTDARGLPCLALFISPLSAAEIGGIRASGAADLDEVIAGMMLRKQLRRAGRLGLRLDLATVRDLEVRAAAAPDELRKAHHFGRVIPNHDGEDSEHWDAFPIPLGDAGASVAAVAALLRGERPPRVETWSRGVMD